MRLRRRCCCSGSCVDGRGARCSGRVPLGRRRRWGSCSRRSSTRIWAGLVRGPVSVVARRRSRARDRRRARSARDRRRAGLADTGGVAGRHAAPSAAWAATSAGCRDMAAWPRAMSTSGASPGGASAISDAAARARRPPRARVGLDSRRPAGRDGHRASAARRARRRSSATPGGSAAPAADCSSGDRPGSTSTRCASTRRASRCAGCTGRRRRGAVS